METLIKDKKDYTDNTFVNLNVANKTLEGISFENCKFSQCDFSETKLTKCKFVDCEFVSCNLSLMKVSHSIFSQIDFDRSKMLGVNWTEAKWPQISLNSPINFYQCNISQSSFFGLHLNEIVIEACKAQEVDFREATLSYANFTQTDFNKSLFIHTDLNCADFTEAVNYNIDPVMNKLKKAKFSFPEVVALLNFLEIDIDGLGD